MEPLRSEQNSLCNQGICAVIITHNPDERLLRLLDALDAQVDRILIVDNASGLDNAEIFRRAQQSPMVTMIKNTENIGVAAGLNQGIEEAARLGFEWILTLDQDSLPEAKMVEHQCRLFERDKGSPEIAIVAPKIIDAELGRSSPFIRRRSLFRYERAHCHEAPLEEVTAVITTGSLLRYSAFRALGGFREDFFIDYVDTEFCLRLILNGYKILVACDAHLRHSFGHRRRSQWGPFVFYPSFHPPDRWYTISRNRIQMIKSFGLRLPYWLFYELTATAFILIRMLLMEDERLAKLGALMKGTWDGIMGRMGRPFWAVVESDGPA